MVFLRDERRIPGSKKSEGLEDYTVDVVFITSLVPALLTLRLAYSFLVELVPAKRLFSADRRNQSSPVLKERRRGILSSISDLYPIVLLRKGMS